MLYNCLNIFFRYKSVEPKHLWNSFDTVIDEANYESGLLGNSLKVEEFMNSWTNQAGYPMIYVETSNDSDDLVIIQVCVFKYLLRILLSYLKRI